MGFLDRLFGPSIDENRLSPHRARAGEVADQLVAAEALDRAERRRVRRLPVTDDATLVSLAVVFADRLRVGGAGQAEGMALLAVLARTPLPFQADDVDLLVELAAGTAGPVRRRILSVATTAAEELSSRGSPGIADAVERAIELLTDDEGQEAARLRGRLFGLVRGESVRHHPFDMVGAGDQWSRRVRPSLVQRFGDDVGARALLELLASLHQATPRPIWQRRCEELVTASEGRAGELVALLLGAVVDLQTGRGVLVSSVNGDLIRGAVWTATMIDEPWVGPLLVDVHRRSDELGIEKLTNASRAALGRLGSSEAVAELAGRWWAEGREGNRSRIEVALQDVARRKGTTVSALVEPFVPARPSSRVRRAERRRIEFTLSEDRWWHLPMWTTRYPEHRVSGPLARALVWVVEEAPVRWTAMPGDRAGSFRLVDDTVVEPSDAAVVRPWHPLFADEVELRAWRDHLARHGVRQPVEQVDRPVFRAGAGEALGNTETLRLAEREVDVPLFRRRLRQRGWAVTGQPFRVWTSGERVDVELEFRAGRWQTGAVRFSGPVGEVSPIVFSESVLDVERAIGDPEVRE